MAAQFGLIAAMLVGHAMLGGVVSGRTSTVKQQTPAVPPTAEGALVQQTRVRPGGKTLPDGGAQITGSSTPVQTFVP